METIIKIINIVGQMFVDFSWPVLAQSIVVIIGLLLLDVLIRKKVRAIVRYCFWMLIFLKLILPMSLTLPESAATICQNKLPSVLVSTIGYQQNTIGVNIQTANQQMTANEAVYDDINPETQMPSQQYGSKNAGVSLKWQGAVFLLWFVIVIAMLLLLAQKMRFVYGLIRQAKPAPKIMVDVMEFCKTQVNVKRNVELKISPNANSPAVCGLFKPVILMPENILRNLGSSQLRMILLHELVHVKRADLLVNFVQTLLQIFYFYNPLLWVACAVVKNIREQAVDETIMVMMDERASQYPLALVNVAKMLMKRPSLSLKFIGVVESKSLLKRRIQKMLNCPIPKTSKIGANVLVMLLLMAAVIVPVTRAGKTLNKKILENEIIKNDDGTAVSKFSYNDVGQAVVLDAGKSGYILKGIQIYGSRYGTPKAPAEKFDIYLCDLNFNILKTFKFPYKKFRRTNPKWVTLKTKLVKLPKKFILCTNFRAGKYKGIYVHYDASSSGKNFAALPKPNKTQIPFEKGDWMIRAVVGQDFTPLKNAKKMVYARETVYAKPVVVTTWPDAFANDVKSGSQMISVEFDQEMTDQNWSWMQRSTDTYPATTGSPFYGTEKRKCYLPAVLEPATVYWIGVNSQSNQNFVSKNDEPAKAYVILFATEDENGHPTKIPQKMIDEAEKINGIEKDQDIKETVKNVNAGNEKFNLQKAIDKATNACLRNTFYKNETDVKGFGKTANSILTNPLFTNAKNGDFTVKSEEVLNRKQGLAEPDKMEKLWHKYQNQLKL